MSRIGWEAKDVRDRGGRFRSARDQYRDGTFGSGVVLVCLLTWLASLFASLFAILAVNWLASFCAPELIGDQSGAIAATVLSAAFTGFSRRRQEKLRPENGLAWVMALLSAFAQAIVNLLIFAGLWLCAQPVEPVSDDPPGLFIGACGIFVFLCLSVLPDIPLVRLGFWFGFFGAQRRRSEPRAGNCRG